MKIMQIFGTRPECIKLAPVIKEIEADEELELVVCLTGQHREMVRQLIDFYRIPVDVDLDLMLPDQTPLEFISKGLSKLDRVLDVHKPDWVIVQGDTTSAMAASLAAFHKKIKIGHVEAGLRSFDKWKPFPEEINRKLIGTLADLHFAPTQTAKENLLKESYNENSIFVTGNTVIDALKMVQNRIDEISLPKPDWIDPRKKTILVTLHRRESFGRPMEHIFEGISRLAAEFSDSIRLIYPVHPNPRVKEPAERILSGIQNIILIDPLPYFQLIKLMSESYFVITDSGGIQEEAPGLGKPVLVCRSVTERPEGVDAGVVKLVGTDSDEIYEAAATLLRSQEAYDSMARAVNPYGDGMAAKRIVNALKSFGGVALEHSR
jgi:UDP-N-acetylglucosamine 2-epimerase (non-hydrolysing)